jgi:uncharacterized protein YcbX
VSELRLSSIYRYPVKSARGHALQAAQTDRFGLVGDRRWMLVDDRGHFQSQRRLPALALLDVELLEDGGLRLAFAGEHVDVAEPDPAGKCVIATVWEDTVVAPLADATVNAWLSERLGESLRLVFCPPTALRGVEPGYAPPGQLVAFADGFPLLVIGEASLDLLNSRLQAPVPMNRFRPNLVIAGAAPHAEDDWRRLRIGSAEVELVKPCSRCVIPSIDQSTGERDSQINRVLAAYRRREGVIYFGMNALAPPGARFDVGEAVTVID